MAKFLFFKKEGIEVPEPFQKTLEALQIELIFLQDLGKDQEPSQKLSGILVLGGDGTFLKAVPYAYQYQLPILGVNMGKFGFLTEITLSEFPEIIKAFLENKITFEERTLLKVEYKGKEEVVLNEGAILKGPLGKIITLKVRINEMDFTEIYGDGLIVSTPTGSTAYNLSAGGPVVHPKVSAFILTPICPFKIHLRPFVLPDIFPLEVILEEGEGEVHLLLDGRENWFIEKGKPIRFTRAERKIKLVPSTRKDYLQILREKFNW